MSSPAQVIGVDVGGTKVAVAAVTPAGELAEAIEHPTALTSADDLLAGIEAAVKEVEQRAGRADAVGLGVPSQIEFATGRVLASVNIPLEGVALRDELERRFGVPVYVDNDANCAALAEAQLVEGGPARFLAMYTLGTGVGGGLVIDGRIYRGATGLGAELGHTVVDANGPPCPGSCPNRGCLEALCSGTALGRDAAELAQDRPDSVLGRVLREKGAVDARDAVAAAGDGDEDSLRLLERLGTYLGVGIANAVNAFEPEHIVIGGGLSRAGDLFLETARREAASRALPALWERVSVSLARGGSEAGLIGAGLLALQERAASEDTARPPTEEGVR